MKTALIVLVVLCWVAETGTAATKKKSSSRGHVRIVATHGRSRGRTRKAVAPTPHVQGEPTADRYREIQGALAAKGYLKAEPSGAWDAATEEAMRRYQTDNRFEATGRINSKSLIGLGLGGGSQEPH